MTDDDLKSLFEGVDRIEPGEEARARARQAALAAFAGKNAQVPQGNVTPLRPTPSSNPLDGNGRSRMNMSKRQWLMGGAASAAVVVLAVSVVMKIGNPPFEPRSVLPVASEGTAPKPALPEEARRDQQAQLAKRQAENAAAEREAVAGPAKGQAMADSVSQEMGSVASAPTPTTAQPRPSAPQASRKMVAAAPPSSAPVLAEVSPPAQYQEVGRDRFEAVDSSPVKSVATEPVSTFSVDVDTASYSFVRRQLNQGVLPQKDAVRLEEMLNYFDYDYPLPDSRETPFKATVTVTDSPWKPGNKLLHIGIRGYELPRAQHPASNLVFLLDVSGSMNSPDKLPLVKQSMGLLLSQLQPSDTVSIVVYAGAAGTVLEPTPANEKQKILAALDRLSAGGSTAGGEGIQLAYQLARSSFKKDAVNRVILATDGDFNVGITSNAELQGFIERQRDEGIYLSVLGFGQGNYHDQLMQALAQNGNGVAAYIDTLGEAQKLLVDEASSTLFPIAKDVKLQLEFNPQTVSEYRLLGYETRALKQEDFNNDKVDAGDIGAGHRVTAIYEITPVGAASGLLEPSRYQPQQPAAEGHAREYGFLKIRYKLPEESSSRLITTPIPVDGGELSARVARETAFATAVAGFAELLKGGQYSGNWSYQDAIKLANSNKGEDLYGYRSEFVQLVRKAEVAAAMK